MASCLTSVGLEKLYNVVTRSKALPSRVNSIQFSLLCTRLCTRPRQQSARPCPWGMKLKEASKDTCESVGNGNLRMQGWWGGLGMLILRWWWDIHFSIHMCQAPGSQQWMRHNPAIKSSQPSGGRQIGLKQWCSVWQVPVSGEHKGGDLVQPGEAFRLQKH